MHYIIEYNYGTHKTVVAMESENDETIRKAIRAIYGESPSCSIKLYKAVEIPLTAELDNQLHATSLGDLINKELGKEVPNYWVYISDSSGHRRVPCKDAAEVWDAIGQRNFGGLYEVSSPQGLDCGEFTAF